MNLFSIKKDTRFFRSTHIIITILGLKLKIKYFSLLKYFKFKFSKYQIISLGTSCLPRVITTKYELKAEKIYGEKSCPFDFITINVPTIIKLLKNQFEGLCDNLEYNDVESQFENRILGCNFPHDSKSLTNEQIIKKYDFRIKNFYNYMKTNKLVVFVLAVKSITSDEINELYNILSGLRKNKKFILFIINNSELEEEINNNNIRIVNNVKNLGSEWAEKLRTNTEEVKQYEDLIIPPLKDFINTSLKN